MKAPTTTVEHEGITFHIPTGLLTPPSAEAERIMKAHHDPRGWKYATKPYHTYDKVLADAVAYGYDFYCGGHELTAVRWDEFGTLYRVTTKGYYHYVGA